MTDLSQHFPPHVLEWARAQVKAAPPITPAQARRIAQLLTTGGDRV